MSKNRSPMKELQNAHPNPINWIWIGDGISIVAISRTAYRAREQIAQTLSEEVKCYVSPMDIVVKPLPTDT